MTSLASLQLQELEEKGREEGGGGGEEHAGKGRNGLITSHASAFLNSNPA